MLADGVSPNCVTLSSVLKCIVGFDVRQGVVRPLRVEATRDHLSLPEGSIIRLRLKRFKEAQNGLIEEYWIDYKKGETKISSSADQGLTHVIGLIHPLLSFACRLENVLNKYGDLVV